MTKENEIYRYCRDHIENFDLKERLAFNVIDRNHCPLSHASERLYREMEDCICEWADENNYSVDFADGVDIEAVFWAGAGE